MSIPIFEAAPKPPKKLKGIEITKAQGHETTRKDKARYNQMVGEAWKKTGGITANSTAIKTTIGV